MSYNMDLEDYNARAKYLARLRLTDEELHKLGLVRNDYILVHGDERKNWIVQTKKKYRLVQEERKGGNIEVLQYKYKKHWYDILKKSEVDELLRLAHTHQWEKDEDKKTRVGIFV